VIRRAPQTKRDRTDRGTALVAKDERGEIRVDSWAGIATTEVKGHLTGELAQRLSSLSHTLSKTGGIAAFHDWEGMSGYDPAVRSVLGKMLDEGRTRFGTTHILVGSSLAGMGVSIAATLLGQSVRCHTSRGSWKEALDAVEHEAS
jgi:hypothetical protein